MTKENTQEFAVALNSSPSEGAGEGSEAKRNKKTQLLSALLSASALGLFLEGCGGGGGGTPTPPTPAVLGTESNPYLATANADTFSGSGSRDWVSYENSNAGVTIDLSNNPATVSDGWAAGDTLSGINNLIGSRYDDTLTGNNQDNILRGGEGADTLTGGEGEDTYVFNAGDGTDTITDSGGSIYFEQGANNDYTGAVYTFTRANFGNSEAVTLTVSKGSNTLNVLEFANDPSSDYTFYTRSDGTLTEIPASSLVVPPRVGSEANPFLATAVVDIFPGSIDYDWVSYENSNAGVTIDLSNNPATVSDGWAAGDTLSGINNLIGSRYDDTLTGNNQDNILRGGEGADTLTGGAGEDTYVFNLGDGTDTITDDGGSIYFEQGANNDYTGAAYTFTRASEGRGEAVTLTVSKGGNTLNVLEFANDPSSDYTFYTRSDGTLTEIPASSLVVPPRVGSEANPFLATSAANTFTGSAGFDWVSYAGSNEGVTIDLSNNPATVSDGWAEGDRLTNINNLIGSRFADTLAGNNQDNILSGGAGADSLTGGEGEDTYVFNLGDGTDTITDDGGSIYFEQGANNDYTGAAYTFTRASEGRGEAVTLTVSKGSNTLNVLEFANDPSSDYTFYTRDSDGIDSEIDSSLFVVPPRVGSEDNPFLATSAANTFTGSAGFDWVSYEDATRRASIG